MDVDSCGLWMSKCLHPHDSSAFTEVDISENIGGVINCDTFFAIDAEVSIV